MLPKSAAEMFDHAYSVEAYPSVPPSIALIDGVDRSSIELARGLGIEPIDLIDRDPADALRELQFRRIAAILGRSGMDTLFEQMDDEGLWKLRDSGVHVISRLGNGVTMQVQRAFDNGLVVERTPRGNAEAVRIWQDFALLAMLSKNQSEAADRNFVILDDRLVKQGEIRKLHWSRTEVNPAVNPKSLPFDEAPPEAKAASEFLRGKKVAVIGPGRIGMEVIRNSPFLRYANIFAYDIVPGRSIDGVTVTNTIEEALEGAELVLIHMDGKNEIMGARELALLKIGAMICNMARGKNINPRDLLAALEFGQISKAALDTHVVEGKELLPFQQLPLNVSEWKPGHFAHALRMHGKVLATNHSAASEFKAQDINAHDGIRAVYRYMSLGEIIDGVGSPRVEFPYGGFVQELEGNGFMPSAVAPGRIALELIHDGDAADLLVETRLQLAQMLGGKLNIVSGALTNVSFADSHHNGELRRNSVSFDSIDLPHHIKEIDRRLFLEISRRAEAVRGVHLARVFVPRLKTR